MTQPKGNVILINGTSCAGKSSTAEYLIARLDGDFEHISWDDYVLSIRQDESLSDEQKNDLLSLFLQQTCDKLDAGENLILDVVCVPAATLERLRQTYAPYGLFTIYMEAPPEVLRERELVREDRANGQAEEQYHQIHEHEDHGAYDMEFDSSVHSTEQIGESIISTYNARQQQIRLRQQPRFQ